MLGVAALAVATAGSVGAGSPSATGGVAQPGGGADATDGVGAALARAVPFGELEQAPTEMELERPVRVRVSRDGGRQSGAVQRLGNQAADAVATAKARAAEERAAAKRAAEKRAAAKRAAEAKRWRLPLAKGSYRLTAKFGECSRLWARCHTGLDFAAPSGTPVRAIAPGKVVEAAYSGAYGNRTIVRLADGTEMWYSHLSASVVSAGQQVKAGQKIGTVGSTGNSTGPHLHLEIHPAGGEPVDPLAAMRAERVAF